MASIWQKTLFYLGLVDEDEAAGYPHDRVEGYGHPEDPSAGSNVTARPSSGYEPDAQFRQPRSAETRQERPEESRSRRRRVPERRIEQHSGAGVSGRRVDPPMTSRRRMAADSALADAGVIATGAEVPVVRTLTDADLHTEIIAAKSYSDAQALADFIRSSTPVVLDLRNVEPAMVRRLVDFASGLTYALGGSMRKIGQGVILVTPANVNITRDERRRLADMGYYQSDED